MAEQNPFENPTVEIMKKIETLEREVRRLSTLAPLFTVLNENSPAQITATQNNYAPGDYDVLLITTDAARTMTGISGGVKGRVLHIFNVGTVAGRTLILPHNSASSSVGNRILTATAASVTLDVLDSVTLYYDDSALSGDGAWRVHALAQ